jgi:hypothetical protein
MTFHKVLESDTQHNDISIKSLCVTLSINDTLCNHALHYAEGRYAACRVLFIVMLCGVIMLNINLLIVVMLEVVILGTVAPFFQLSKK